MSGTQIISNYELFTDINGEPLDAGYVWIGQPNTDPRLFPVSVYFDAALTIPATMPLRTSNGYIDHNGSRTFVYINGNYSIRAENKNTSLIYSVTDFLATGNRLDSGMIGYKLQSSTTTSSLTVSDKLAEIKSLDDFYIIGDTDWYPAFRRAASSGFAFINVRARDYSVNNSAGDKLANMVVFGNTNLHFEAGSRILFNYNGLPLFLWQNATSGGMSGYPKFIYTGNTQITDDYTTAQFRTRLGLTNLNVGGAYELRSVLMRINCNNVRFGDKLVFRSNTQGDAGKGICFCINDKGDENNLVQTVGIEIGEADFEDCIHGILSQRQSKFNYEGPFRSRRRFGHASVAPGHIIYLTGTTSNGKLSDGFIGDVIDNGAPITVDGNALAPMAVKGTERCTFGTLKSSHPQGLHQTFTNVTNCIFGDMTFNYSGVVEATASQFNIGGSEGDVSRNTFGAIRVYSPNVFFKIAGSSTQLVVNNFFPLIDVVCPHNDGGAGGSIGVIDMYGNSNIINLRWNPTTAATLANYKPPFIERQRTIGNTVGITLRGPNVSRYSARVLEVGPTTIDYPVSVTDVDRGWEGELSTVYREATQASKWATIADVTSGAKTYTFQLPARGAYLINASVWRGPGAPTNIQSGTWVVSFSNEASLASAQLIGSLIGVVSQITTVNMAVSQTGLVTLSYTKTGTFFEEVDFSFTRMANISRV